MRCWKWLAIVAAVGTLMGCASDKRGVAIKPVGVTEEVGWVDRVIPLPKEIRVRESVMVAAGDIAFALGAFQAPTRAATSEVLAAFAKGDWDGAVIRIDARLVTPKEDAALFKKLSGLKNRDQAYAVASENENGCPRIALRALTPVGLFYAAKTLSALVRAPEGLKREDPVTMPLPNILDWPDIEERGSWGGQKLTVTDFAWFSRWKLNYFMATGINFWPVLNPETNAPETRGELALPALGGAYGVRVVFPIAHLDSQSIIAGLNAALTEPSLARWRGALKTPPPGYAGKRYGVCPTSPEFHALLDAWARQIAAKTYPYHREICVWFSENSNPCYCSRCAGGDVYAIEARAIETVFRALKKDFPDLRLRLLYSQGVYPRDPKDLDRLDKDTGLCYYSGHGTYVTDRKPMIYPLIEGFAKSGRFLEVVPQFSHDIRTIVPFTCPQFIHFRMNEFADKKLSCVDSFNVPSRHFYEFNLAAEGEWGWNAKGRTPREFARAYATVLGMKDPALFAEWAESVGAANYDLAETRMFCRLTENPMLGQDAAMPWDQYFAHSRIARDPKALAEAIAAAKKALELAKRLDGPDILDESRFTLAGLEAFRDIGELTALTRKTVLSSDEKTRVEELLDRVFREAVAVGVAVYAWQERGLARAKTPSPGWGERSKPPVLGLLDLADYLATKAERLGAPKRWANARPVDVGEWTADDFRKGTAKLRFDVTPLIDAAGGEYQFALFPLDGLDVELTAAALARESATGEKTAFAPKAAAFAPREKNVFALPGRPEGAKDILELTLNAGGPNAAGFPEKFAPDARVRDGLIAWRRLWRSSEEIVASNGPAAVAVKLDARPARARETVSAQPGEILVGVVKGEDSDAIAENLNASPGCRAVQLTRLDSDALKPFAAVIVTAKTFPTRVNRAVGALRDYAANGGGVLCLHSGVGYRGQVAVFGEFGSVSGSFQGGDARILNVAHPILSGLDMKTLNPQSNAYKSFLMSWPNDRNLVVLGGPSAKDGVTPLLIAAPFEQGRVVLCGLRFPTKLKDIRDAAALQREAGQWRLLLNAIRWAAKKPADATPKS